MVKRNIIFISSILFILNSCDNDDIPMYFRSMQPSGGKLFKGSVKEYFINSLPKKMYIGSKDFNFDSTYSEEQQEAEGVVPARARGDERDPAPAHSWDHPRVRRQDAHG